MKKTSKEKQEKTPKNVAIEIVTILVSAIVLALLIQAFLIKPYQIPSGSMEPTLKIGQRVLVNRIANRFTDPKVGQITVFKPPKNADEPNPLCAAKQPGQGCSKAVNSQDEQNFIKRVVAGPGDTIAVVRGHVILNGKRQKEPYIDPCLDQPICNLPVPVKVPPGHYYMMGDNRDESQDSRYWGPVPRDWIIGRAFFTYWPLNRIGTN